MKLHPDPRLPQGDNIALLRTRMYDLHREIALAFNQMADKLQELEKRIAELEP